ncbi:MAG TPA: hypothetical protein VF329_02895 [Gammaproteobacteria bacterium]
MDAKDNGTCNPFADTLCSLEWIASAMDAARRHNEQKRDPQEPAEEPDRHAPSCGDPG